MDEIPATQVIELGLDDSSSQDEEEEGKMVSEAHQSLLLCDKIQGNPARTRFPSQVAELILSESEKYPIYVGENRIGRNPDGSVDVILDRPVSSSYICPNMPLMLCGN